MGTATMRFTLLHHGHWTHLMVLDIKKHNCTIQGHWHNAVYYLCDMKYGLKKHGFALSISKSHLLIISFKSIPHDEEVLSPSLWTRCSLSKQCQNFSFWLNPILERAGEVKHSFCCCCTELLSSGSTEVALFSSGCLQLPENKLHLAVNYLQMNHFSVDFV